MLKEKRPSELLLNKVSIHNDLIRNCKSDYSKATFYNEVSKLNFNEKRLLCYLISKIKPKDENFEQVYFDFKDFCEIMNIQRGGNTYNDIIKAIKNLMKKVFEVKSDGKTIFFHWLEDGENGTIVYENGNYAYLKLSESLRPFLLGLEKNFSAYQLGYIIQFKSKYAITIYEYLKAQKGDRENTVLSFKLETCLEKFVDNKYKTYNDLNKVLTTALKDISDFSDIKVTHIPIKKHPDKKTHCQIEYIKFSIHEKSNKDKYEIWKNLGFYPIELKKLNIVDCEGNILMKPKKPKKGDKPKELEKEELENISEKDLQELY